MTDDDGARRPIDQAVDLLVLRPVGLVLDLPAALPRFFRQGRRALHLENLQLDALRLDPSRSADALEQLQCHLHRTLRALGIGTTAQEARGDLPDELEPDDGPAAAAVVIPVTDEPDEPDEPEVARPVGRIVAGATVIGGIASRVDDIPLRPPPRPRIDDQPTLVLVEDPADVDPDTDADTDNDTDADNDGPDAEGLAIPGYDSLSASQVVPRLESLHADELELVRQYEQVNRGRKTILSKIAQLQP